MIPYIGGKYKMAKWIEPFIPQDIETYVEVFGGAFWVYCKSNVYKRHKLKNVIYNDFNKYMSNLFECCRSPEIFSDHMKNIEAQNETLFNKYQEEINIRTTFQIPDYDLGMKYAYLATQVFSGAKIMESKFMPFHHPEKERRGNNKFDTFRNRLNNPMYQLKLKNITHVENLDYSKVIEKYDSENTFFYVDPPYWKTENYYSSHEFDAKDHELLCKQLKEIKGKFALSYYEFDELFQWLPKKEYVWEQKLFTKLASAVSGSSQSKGKEVLVMNYPLKQLKLFKEENDTRQISCCGIDITDQDIKMCPRCLEHQ